LHSHDLDFAARGGRHGDVTVEIMQAHRASTRERLLPTKVGLLRRQRNRGQQQQDDSSCMHSAPHRSEGRWPLERMVTSPLKLSALMRASPLPTWKVNRFVLPMPCSPGVSVIGKSLSMDPVYVDTVSNAPVVCGITRYTPPECEPSSLRPVLATV